VDAALVHLGIKEALLKSHDKLADEVLAELLEPGPGDGDAEIDAVM
jgi:hypothetical protein